MYKNHIFEFSALPFGLSTSPRVFTRVTRVIAAHLQWTNVKIFKDIDDWLVIGRSKAETTEALQ